MAANQDETDIDCGGSCGVCAVGQDCNADQDCQSNNCDAGVCQEPGEELPDGSPCTSDGQCASDNCQAGTCAPEASCTAQSAIDLGPPGHSTTVPANACLRVNDGYPSWWNQRNLSFQNLPTSVTYPVGVSWSSSCTGASGTTTITGHWQSKSFGPTNEDCATLIQLGGNSSEQMTVRYYAQ